MNEHLLNQSAKADRLYRMAEERAARYFGTLKKQAEQGNYAARLTGDFRQWKRQHISPLPLRVASSIWKREPAAGDYARYIQWMNKAGKLDDYLSRSVSYMFLRDLGRSLDDNHTRNRIAVMTDRLRRSVLSSAEPGAGGLSRFVSFAAVYRWAAGEGIQPAVLWVIAKLRETANHLPEEMDAAQAQRKLIKIIIGVVLHVLEDMERPERVIPREERVRRLDEAIRIGYCYGLTYPFIDDLLDSKVLTAPEKERYSAMIRQALLAGAVPDPGSWPEEKTELIRFVHAELGEAFDYIRNRQKPETEQDFFSQAYLFFQSQHLDRIKDLRHPGYTNEELFLPIILKSSSSRRIVRSVIAAEDDGDFDRFTFYYGIYNQLADDFADLEDDLRDGAVTPYTYYYTHRHSRPDLINPYELYWTVIAHLLHEVYRSEAATREVLLDRAINGLKRAKAKLGKVKYREKMAMFAGRNAAFDRLVQRMVEQAGDVAFFDKLLRDEMVSALRRDREDKERFRRDVAQARERINGLLPVGHQGVPPEVAAPLTEAANYSLEGSGKRLRPVLTWMMAVRGFGLDDKAVDPLLRSLEYMHTASLVFDDLPSQDNASMRRGKATLHVLHGSAKAELTGLFLIQRAMKEQASLSGFDPQAVLALIRYSAQKAEEMCMGQEMDLRSREGEMTVERLNAICYYKTGIGFEAALVMPAILAGAEDADVGRLEAFARHAGIAFQIRDDLLDLEGDGKLLGKPVGQDEENGRGTFVSLLGAGEARKAMWEHYCSAESVLDEMNGSFSFLRHLLDYIVHRKR